MEDKSLEQLRSKKNIETILSEFNAENSELFKFDQFHKRGQWHALWRALFSILTDQELTELYPLCLNTVRILTRDEFSLQTQVLDDDLTCLLKLAHLRHCDAVAEDINDDLAAVTTELDEITTESIVEALKCLCNLVFQSPDCRRQCVKQNATDAILKRVASSTRHSCAVELYDMKLLFLITAMDPFARNKVQLELNGIAYMTEWLDDKLALASYSDEQLDLLCEMLKVMFNITTCPDKSPNENEIQSRHLTGVVREMLLRFGSMSNIRERNVIMHAINLLTNVSTGCLTELVIKHEQGESHSKGTVEFEGHNVRVLSVLLSYLRLVLDEQESSASSNELVAPVLTVLVKCVRANRVMRRFVRSVVLPPLRDFTLRPEVGKELRNHLCRFLTFPATVLRDLAAELLFVCCKENVGRMIKYTGYGNAAGLFAKRGLMGGQRVENSEYSSDSEDSDTEEYKEMQHGINPVIGCYEPPTQSPLEGMTDEQKEYEAVKLANLMDKLHKSGIITPGIIGEDGKPQPVDHILQLQEELPQQKVDQKRKT